jgi:carboxymethylenebutenolidase
MGKTIEFPSNGHTVGGYLARGEGPAPGIVLIQEWWGVVDQIKGVADRLAAEGFTVLVPDLYHGPKASEPDDAEKLMLTLDLERAERDLCSGVAYLQGHEAVGGNEIGCVGFCMGGGLAIYLATIAPDVAATVVYYGGIPWGNLDPDLTAVQGDVILHYASEDDWATPEFGRAIEQGLRESGTDATLYLYEGAQHAFLDETRPESHDPEATRLSWERTVAFLRSRLERAPAGSADSRSGV